MSDNLVELEAERGGSPVSGVDLQGLHAFTEQQRDELRRLVP